jgi:type II secretory pathway pseudopilin PulG
MTVLLNRKGFSLLGVVIASGMVILVVFGAVGLLQGTRRANAQTEQRMVATFLAREALELVRAVRDRNWFSTDTTNTGTCPIEGTTCAIFWRGTPGSVPGEICDGFSRIEERSVDTIGLEDVAGDPATSDATRLFRFGSRYEYDHDPANEADWVLTPYRR